MGNEEFWGEDAAAVQKRDVELATGMRMPKASDTRSVSAGVTQTRPTAASKRGPLPLAVTAIVAVACVGSIVIYVRLPVVSLAEFSAMQTGMTVEECNAIVGVDGVTAVEARLPPGTFLPEHIQTIEWVNSDKSVAAAGFADGKLISKAHEKLK